MSNVVFYQGETIPINICGSDIDNNDFVLLVYPHYRQSEVLEFRKSDFKEETHDGNKLYRCVISHLTTGLLSVGEYAIEVMVRESSGYRSVYQKFHAFTIKFSNAKKIEL